MAVSLSGLDMSWMKRKGNRLKKAPPKPRQPNFNANRSSIFGNGSCYVLPDLDVAYKGGFESPLDGTFISSRSQLREHNIRHEVIQAGENHGKTKDLMKKHMKHDPERRSRHGFSWQERESRPSGNLTEI